MPKKKYSLEEGKPKRLEISWHGGAFQVRSDIKVLYDKAQLAFFPDRVELEKGKEILIPDGSALQIILISNAFRITYHGQLVDTINTEIRLCNFSLLYAFFLFLGGLLVLIFKIKSSNFNFYPSFSISFPKFDDATAQIEGIWFLGLGFMWLANWYFSKKHFLRSFVIPNLLLLSGAIIFDLVFTRYAKEFPNIPNLEIVAIITTISLAEVFAYSRREKRIQKAD